MSRAAVVLAGSPDSEQVATALGLAERLLARGVRVTLFAHGDAVRLTAAGNAASTAIAALLRRGLHGGTLDWVIDTAAAERLGVAACQAPGVVPGDSADLWAFVRDADLVLTAGGNR